MTSAARLAPERGWFLYDWGNSAFATVCMTAVLPPLVASLANQELGAPAGTVAWAWTAAAGLAVGAVLAPPLGALADARGWRKRLLLAFALGGAAATAALALVLPDSWRAACVLYVLAATGFAGANVFYDGLLPGLGPPEKWDDLSARGYAWGYAGGGVALIGAAAIVLAGEPAAAEWAFVLVGVWWAVFTVPLMRHVPEPPVAGDRRPFRRLAQTLKEARRHPDLWRFLLAYWLYSDGIGTVIKLAGAYGAELGVPLEVMLAALVATQFVGVPATLLFGRLGARIGARAGILVALSGYVGIVVLGYFMRHAWQFVALALLVGCVQGGAQALSRSLFAHLVPAGREAEYFSFLDISGRMAGVAGPLIFAVVTGIAGHGRAGILAVLALFVAGGWLLAGVKVSGGRHGHVKACV